MPMPLPDPRSPAYATSFEALVGPNAPLRFIASTVPPPAATASPDAGGHTQRLAAFRDASAFALRQAGLSDDPAVLDQLYGDSRGLSSEELERRHTAATWQIQNAQEAAVDRQEQTAAAVKLAKARRRMEDIFQDTAPVALIAEEPAASRVPPQALPGTRPLNRSPVAPPLRYGPFRSRMPRSRWW